MNEPTVTTLPGAARPDAERAPGLTSLDGIGEALAQRIVKAFGTEAAFLEAAKNGEVDRLSAVEGISTRKAVELVLKVQGREPLDFLRTPRAETLYEDVLARIREYANTDHARNRIALLVPHRDAKALERHVDWVLRQRDMVAKLPRTDIARLLGKLSSLRTPRPKYDSGFAVLVDLVADYEALVKAGVDKHCQILTPEDAEGGADYEVIVYAFSQGSLDLTGAENVIPVPFTKDVTALVPRAALRYFQENRPVLETAAALAEKLGRKTVIPDVLTALDSLDKKSVDFDSVEKVIRETVDWMNAEVKARMQQVSLQGDALFEMMSGKTPKAVTQIQTDVLRAGKDTILDKTGDVFDVFTDGFPLAVDDEQLERARHEFVGRRKRALFREEVQTARRLADLKPQVEQEVIELLEFDYAFALGAFALDYALTKPTIGEGFAFKGALHLNLIRQGGARIDYELRGEHNVVLLTGANSGGKTTLLETVAQASLLAQLGLPVNAEEATVEIVDALYFFTQKRSLDAGAFESFLRGFIPIVTSPSKKLVLADELEAMTELDAAARIVGTFIDMLHDSKSYGVCVSHMADEVSNHTRVRIDGIEARGIDEEGNLIVDRTPRMGYRARSTPEFILRRLLQTSKGDEKKVYEAILAKFE